MRVVSISLMACALLAAGAPASAQNIPSTAQKPDPASIISVAPGDLQWKPQNLGQLQATLWGDPAKPGSYGVLIKWLPGHMSHPHFHSTDRWAYVVSGTWWVSTSTHFDPATTYPVKQGTFATDIANKVHWDGAKDEEVVILVAGEGPMTTSSVPEK